jgi:hypothetical protein
VARDFPKPNFWGDLLGAIASLEQRSIADGPEDADALYRLAVLRLEEYSWANGREQLRQARDALRRAVGLRPGHAPSQAALGYVHDLLGARNAKQALACLREARRLSPRDKIYEIYVITLLQEAGEEEEALAEVKAAALRHGVDLKALLRELDAAGMKADAAALLQGFLRARNFLKSQLRDEAEQILNRLQPGRAQREAVAQHTRCAEDQRELARRFRASRVPVDLRALSVWASRYGIGDDYCRPYLLKRLPKKQREQLVRTMDRHAAALQAWLDSFAEGRMTDEAAAFMYLAEGVEEIRDD